MPCYCGVIRWTDPSRTNFSSTYISNALTIPVYEPPSASYFGLIGTVDIAANAGDTFFIANLSASDHNISNVSSGYWTIQRIS